MYFEAGFCRVVDNDLLNVKASRIAPGIMMIKLWTIAVESIMNSSFKVSVASLSSLSLSSSYAGFHLPRRIPSRQLDAAKLSDHFERLRENKPRFGRLNEQLTANFEHRSQNWNTKPREIV